MKAEPKGQRVKTFKHWIPQPDLTRVATQVVVYLKADSGAFHIYDGKHMLDVCRNEAQNGYDTRLLCFGMNSVSSSTLNELVRGFESLCKLYERILREMQKTKVIRFTFKRNLPWRPERHGAEDISFCGKPAIHFDFEVLWRVDDKLYRGDEDGLGLQFAGSIKDRFDKERPCTVVNWSKEREAFFVNMRDSLIELIDRVEEFTSDLEKNVTAAIAGNSTPLLTGPRLHDPSEPYDENLNPG